MLSKTLKFDQDVVAILRSASWSDDGLLAVLTCGQLDRKTYENVNKALEAMGGKWTRKVQGHIFPTDPRPQVEGLLETGSLQVVRDGFFETPLDVVRRMTEIIDPTGNVLEPSAGLGAIADHLPILQDRVLCIEKNEQRAAALVKKGYTTRCMDFLEFKPRGEYFDTIFMNPPFEEGQDIDHVKHAYALLSPGGSLISVMSEGPFFRNDRKAIDFRHWLHAVGAYDEKLPEGSFKSSGTGVAARLVWINK